MAKHRHKTPVSVFVLLLQLSLAVVKVVAQIPSPKLDRDARGIYSSAIANITEFISDEARREAYFCIVDPIDDWNKAFNYENYSFVASCMTNQEDFAQRLCSAAEIKFYLNNIVKQTTHFKPSRNCNLSSWPDGCEPGWACSTGLRDSDPSVDLKAQKIPLRSTNCKPCCEGFFCPQGLTCMIPCPLGAYCPRATYNDSTGLCDPYTYRLPAGRPSHTCGGANIWADIGTSKDIFCPAGSYCPTTTEKNGCHDGHYCLTGSTNENRCSKLISCKANTESQNIRTYGIMLIIALIALLFIIYNCSGQMLHIRDRRHARSRERAVRSVQESERARAKWKAAKNAAKKHASQLHVNFSRKFSRQRHEEEIVILQDMDLEVYGSFRSPPSPSRSKGSTLEVEGSLEGSSNLAARVRASEDESHSSEGSTSEVERKSNSTTKRRSKAKANTNTMIFEYAYSEIEKEKSREEENKNITFSRVISMATNSQSGKRPSIEVAFKDLTLTLKGKKKLLLRSLNGQIVPGRITSVMGPSGAGKTTFLSALAGKATGCRRSGSILINGRPDPIHSYKKIIGFVPQDDIVHGNLTVEENLWFSARCRLSTTLSEADKVLIVERVIENLGLQEVRDSLVGTVEKRGISGGQRKRVNVGLEMVMEPSLLFLDEPTSGLDSSSSRLLLRALRHEAHAGVNICMVVHQPSYTLFQMFDDLILLAKGGFMVYHGSIRKVEEYFRGLGIDVPQRVNPPDYYIDILEGLVEPSKNPGLSYKELPLRWMLHNGYSVPPDMHSSAAGLTVSTSNSSSISDAAPEELSFGRELWSDVRCNIELQRDQLHHTFLGRKDFSNRRTPNIFIQYKYFLGRISKQRLRESRLQATDYLILLIAGACLGAIAKISDASFGAFDYSYTVIAISLLCQIAALRTFMIDKLQCWRERSSGISSLAHFLAKDTVDHFNTLIKPVVYLSMYYFFTNPRSTFLDNYIVLVCLVYCVTGMGYAFAIFFDPGPAQLFSVLIPVCLTLLSSQSFSNESLKGIATLCYPKWVLEAFVIANAKRYYGVWLMTRCGVLMKLGFDLHHWRRCLIIVFLFGAVSRIIAFIAMLTVQKT